VAYNTCPFAVLELLARILAWIRFLSRKESLTHQQPALLFGFTHVVRQKKKADKFEKDGVISYFFQFRSRPLRLLLDFSITIRAFFCIRIQLNFMSVSKTFLGPFMLPPLGLCMAPHPWERKIPGTEFKISWILIPLAFEFQAAISRLHKSSIVRRFTKAQGLSCRLRFCAYGCAYYWGDETPTFRNTFECIFNSNLRMFLRSWKSYLRRQTWFYAMLPQFAITTISSFF